jgi:fatty-acyl-CoA synthase
VRYPHFAFWPPQLTHNLVLPATALDYNLTVSATRYPDRSFIIFYGTEISWRETDAMADRIAAYLQGECGLRRGDRVVLYMRNCPQFIFAYYGVLRAGGIIVPVNPLYRLEEVSHYIADTEARVAFCGQELIDNILPLVGRSALTRIIAVTYADFVPADPPVTVTPNLVAPRLDCTHEAIRPWQDAADWRGRIVPVEIGPDDVAVLPYTSGSTGQPKGCIHTHATVMATTVGGALWEELSASSTAFVSAPLCHVTGMQFGMNRCVYVGATMVLMQQWDPLVAADLIQRYACSHWNTVPVMYVDILSHPDISPHALASLRVASGGGAAMPHAIAQKLKDLYGLNFMEGYGLSETMAPSHTNPPHRAKMQCIGIPLFGVESLIVDPNTMSVLPSGSVGEIILRAPQLFKGYWNNEEATRESFVEIDGRAWFRTGDLGWVDEDGYFFFADRLKRMINVAGNKVWPAEVETLMYRHPAVKECCVIGSPDPRRGETVKAVVVLRPDGEATTAESLMRWATQNMAAYKAPRRIEFVGALPRNASGKIDWRRLQEQENAAHGKGARHVQP